MGRGKTNRALIGGFDMRLDKFLKVSRLIKRRTLAKEVADELTIRFGQKIVTVKINELKETTKKEDATNMYSLVREEKVKAEEGLF